MSEFKMAPEASSKPLLRGLTMGFGSRWVVGGGLGVRTAYPNGWHPSPAPGRAQLAPFGWTGPAARGLSRSYRGLHEVGVKRIRVAGTLSPLLKAASEGLDNGVWLSMGGWGRLRRRTAYPGGWHLSSSSKPV